MKILIISDEHPDMELGGAARIAYQTASWLARDGHDVWFLASTPQRPCVGERSSDNVHEIVVRIPDSRIPLIRALFSMRGVWEARVIAKRLKPDVIHAHGIHRRWSFSVLQAVRPFCEKLIWTAHDAMSTSSGKVRGGRTRRSVADSIRGWWAARMISKTDTAIAVSDALREHLIQVGICTAMRTLHNAIDVAAWQNIPCGGSSALPLRSVLLGGRLSGLKGLFVAIDAMKKVRETYPDAVLVLAGGPDSAFRKAAQYAGDTTMLKEIGHVTHAQMGCLMRGCAAVLVPSLYLDPFPTMNLEALALGIPVIGTCHGGTPEIVRHGISGFIVDPADITQLSQAICALLNDHALRSRMGDAGASDVIARFNVRPYTEALIRIYGL